MAGLATDASVFAFGTKAGEIPNCKSGFSMPAGASSQIPSCPQCGATKIYLAGLRYLKDGTSVQRYFCRTCQRRFSEKPPEKPAESLNTPINLPSKRQICVTEAKNLVPTTETKTVAGGKTQSPFKKKKSNLDEIPAESRDLLLKFIDYLKREGYHKQSQYPKNLSHLVKDGANLLNPESVKTTIASQTKKNGEPWSNSMKLLSTYAYDAFCTMQEIEWKRPKYRQDEIAVYCPEERNLDLLISKAQRKMATFLLTLKYTFADPSEIIRCEWKDMQGNILHINHPVKGHNAGSVELDPQVAAMIYALPRKRNTIFATSYTTVYASFHNLRKHAADEFQNPELLKINLTSFRDWGGTKTAYESNGNVLTIMKALRHKKFESSRKYIDKAVYVANSGFETAVATNPEEIVRLGAEGWTKYDESIFGGMHLHYYRRVKQFGGAKTHEDKDKKHVDTSISSSDQCYRICRG